MKKFLLGIVALLAVGIGVSTSQQVSMPPPAGTTAILCAFNNATQTISTGNVGFVQCDTNGNILLSATPLGAGLSQQVTSDPTVQAATYASGSCLGGWNAVTITVNNGQSGLITNFRVGSQGGSTNTVTLYLMDSSPVGACSDRVAFTLNNSDIDKLLASPPSGTLAAPTGSTASFIGFDFTPPRPFIAGGSVSSSVKTIYYGLVTTAVTPTGATDIHTRTGVVLN